MNDFWNYLKYRLKLILVFILFIAVFAVTFYLYQLPVKAVIYPACLCAGIGIIILICDFLKKKKTHDELGRLKQFVSESTEGFIANEKPEIATEFLNLDKSHSALEEDYRQIITLMQNISDFEAGRSKEKYAGMLDYYTLWAHQIKLPIASMKLALEEEDSEFSRKLRRELARIEGYVEMVLAFLRLESSSTDYVIKEQDIDALLRPVFRKFAGEFISKKINLDYNGTSLKAATDEKWITFVFEQIISNAVKYTNSGSISVYLKGESTLCIKDTGIGIAAEDLPRIFEKGFTGFNGRSQKEASGLGLYLCKRVCTNLGHKITATSEVGQGTIVEIDFSQDKNALYD